MNVLVLRFSSMGDVIVQTPFLRWLKNSFLNCNIHFLTLDINAALIDQISLIDKLHLYSKKDSLKPFVKSIAKKNQIDLVVDLHGTTRSFLSRLYLWHIPSISVDKRSLERFLLVKLKLNLLKSTPSQHSRTILDFKRIFNQSILQDDYSMVSNASKSKSKENFFIIAPGASFESKRYPMFLWVKLVQQILDSHIGLTCKVIAGPEDSFCDEINNINESYHMKISNLQGKRSLKESIREVEGAQFVICNDSLMSHIAQSADVPALVFFGPTSESFGFAPNHPDSKSFSVKDLNCRPCSTTGSKKCSKKELLCFTQIDQQLVLRHIDLLMGLK